MNREEYLKKLKMRSHIMKIILRKQEKRKKNR